MRCDFTLVRHGQTYWNVQHKMQGQVNIPLNEIGRKQAQDLAEELRNVNFDLCVSSPLTRAYDTAQIVLAGRDIPIVKNELLLEQAYGLSEGELQDIGYKNPESAIYHYKDDPDHYVPPIGAESFPQLLDRGKRIIAELLVPMAEKYNSVLIAAHGAILCAVLDDLEGNPVKDFWKTRLDNCGHRTVRYENGQWLL